MQIVKRIRSPQMPTKDTITIFLLSVPISIIKQGIMRFGKRKYSIIWIILSVYALTCQPDDSFAKNISSARTNIISNTD